MIYMRLYIHTNHSGVLAPVQMAMTAVSSTLHTLVLQRCTTADQAGLCRALGTLRVQRLELSLLDEPLRASALEQALEQLAPSLQVCRCVCVP